MKDYCVYCHTTPSKRKYVGISCDPKRRWRNGKGYEKNYLFIRAIEKYGWDNIEHKILYDGLSLDEAKAIEKELIAKWNLTDAQFGFNLTCGGDGILSDATRMRMSEASKGNTRCLGRKLSDKTKDKISHSLCRYYSEHEPAFKGKHHTDETIRKLRERIISDETKEKMRTNHSDVSGAKNPSAKRILQFTMDGKFVKEYLYAKMASDEYGIDLSSIIKCCRNKAKTCGGYVWKYADAEPSVYGWDEI